VNRGESLSDDFRTVFNEASADLRRAGILAAAALPDKGTLRQLHAWAAAQLHAYRQSMTRYARYRRPGPPHRTLRVGFARTS
jgi:hypothetical protein